MARVDLPPRHGDILAVKRLNDDFGYFLDFGRVDELVDLFAEDAIYSNGPRRHEGKAAIREFFAKRSGGPTPRTSRHFYSGLRVTFDSEYAARSWSLWLTFAADGAPPIKSATPYNVADMCDEYAFTDGRWLFRKRTISFVFVDPAVPPAGGMAVIPSGG